MRKMGVRWAHGTGDFHILLNTNNWRSLGTFYHFYPLLLNAPSDLNEESKKIIDELNTSEDPEISQLATVLHLRIQNNFINEKQIALNNLFISLTNQMDQALAPFNLPEQILSAAKKEVIIDSIPGFLKSNKSYLDECYACISSTTKSKFFNSSKNN